MSKASEWAAKLAAADRAAPKPFQINGAEFRVVSPGPQMAIWVPDKSFGHPSQQAGGYMTLSVEGARQIARWILDTFGDEAAS